MLVIRSEQMRRMGGSRLSLARMEHFRRNGFIELRERGFNVELGPGAGEFLVKDNAGGNAHVLSQGPSCSVTTGEGRTFLTEQYEYGRIRSITDPAGNRAYFERNEDETLARLDCGNGHAYGFSIDRSWKLLGIEYPDGTKTRNKHNALGQLVEVEDRNGNLTRYEYSSGGLLGGMIDANGNRTRFQYDGWDLPSAIVYPNGNRHDFGYSEDGLLEQMDVNGEPLARFDRNKGNGRHEIRYNDGSMVRYELKGGLISEATNESVTVQFEYDAQGRLSAEQMGGQRVKYVRNGVGALIGIITPEGEKIGFTRDSDQRLTSITDWDHRRYSFENPAAGPPIRIAFPNGVVDFRTTTPMGLVEDLTLMSPRTRAQPIESCHFEYDLCNRVIKAVRDGDALKYLYDKAGRLIGVESLHPDGVESFQLDPKGNPVRNRDTVIEYDKMDQILRHDGIGFTYDYMGNMISGVCPKGPVVYYYNGGGQVIAARTPAGMAHYSYDAVGRRIRKEIGSRVTRYVWAGARLLGETTIEGSHVSKRDYLWDPDRPIPYAMRENGKIYYLHVGARCEVLCMTDATGSVVWRADYRAFGQARVRAGEVFQPWRLAGQYFDEETGLHYSLARYYDPALGRFLSVDPVMAEGGSRNPYLYCDGDPINSLDPNGTIGGLLSAVLIGAAVGAVIGAAVGAGVEMYRQRNQEHFEWGKIGKAALIGGAIGAIGGAVGGAIEVAAGVTMGVVGAGALAGGLSSAVEHCAEAAITDAEWSWPELGKSVVIGASIGAVTAGVGGLLAARAARKAARAAEQRAAREATESTTKRIRKPNPEIVEKVGPPSRVKTRRETEVPYHNPPEMHVVKPGQPLDVSKMDPTKTYLWSVNREGEMLVAPEAQAGFGVKESLPEGRLVKHRDLTPGEGGLSGGEARAGGEFKIIKDADENPSNLWEMNNNSSSTFRRTDEFMPDESSHQAAFDLLADSGTDTSKIIPVNSHGAKPQ